MESNNTEEAATASQHKEGIIYIIMKDNNISGNKENGVKCSG